MTAIRVTQLPFHELEVRKLHIAIVTTGYSTSRSPLR